jgi:hypothetical protein
MRRGECGRNPTRMPLTLYAGGVAAAREVNDGRPQCGARRLDSIPDVLGRRAAGW